MEESKIKEGNKLIMEFMRYTYYPERPDPFDPSGVMKLRAMWVSEDRRHRIFDYERPGFDSSWDRLMPVIERCTDITGWYQYDSEKYLHITENIFDPDATLSDLLNNNLIGMWARVVEFIEYDNNQKDD